MLKLFPATCLAACTLLVAGIGLAQDAPPPAKTELPANARLAMEAFGVKYPHCTAWTDACQICQTVPEGKISCSTVAIACIQKDITCTAVRWLPPNTEIAKPDVAKPDAGKPDGGK